MLEKQLNKIKGMFQEKNSKRKIENLVVFVIILIVTIIIINLIFKDEKKENDNTSEIQNNENVKLATSKEDDTYNLEAKLEEILKKINGVGNVKVLLTYSETSKTVAMYNEDSTKNDTEETDKQGGNRKVSETSTKKEVIYQEVNGQKIPVTQNIINPKIEGAIITAVGAQNTQVKENIIQAVEAATRSCNTQNSSI